MTDTAIEDRPRPSGSVSRAVKKKRARLQPSGFVWILPALVVSVGLLYYCIGYTAYISTLKWNGMSPNPKHIGLDNYVQILQDPVFWMTIQHTVVFLAGTFVVETALGLLFAVMLHSNVKLAVIYKVLIFVPVVLAPAIMAPVFRQMFAGDGQLNWVLQHIGLGFAAQPWLAQSSTALPVIMAITIWEWTGFSFILYYAAMSQIEPQILEAARLDGASNIRTIVSIIWPEVRGTTAALLILSSIGALKTFDVPYLVSVGGPNYATEFLGTFIYRESIPQSAVGYGAALSIMLLILALGLAIFVSLRSRRKGEAA
jgi:raffinose/stachyose/melibiose transport system permease protein